MEGPIMTVPQPPLGPFARMFLHSRRCKNCRVAFWAGLALVFSTRALVHNVQRHKIRAPFYLLISRFASKRRAIAERAIGRVPYEDLTLEQQAMVHERLQKLRAQGDQPRLH